MRILKTLLLTSATAAAAGAQGRPIPDTAARVDTMITRYMRTRHIPGASIDVLEFVTLPGM